MWITRISNLIALSLIAYCAKQHHSLQLFCASVASAIIVAWVSAEFTLRRSGAKAQTNPQQRSGVQVLNTEPGKTKLQEELGRAREISAPSVSMLYVRLQLDQVEQHLRGRGVRNVLRSSIEHIKPLLRQVDWIVRLGKNDLLVVLPNAANFDHDALAEVLRSRLSGPVHTGDESVGVHAFVAVLNADPSQTADQVIDQGVTKVTEQEDQWQPHSAASFRIKQS